MRRFIAYIAMALSILLCVGVAFTPVFTSMNPGREFSSGNEIVYKISIDEDGTEGTVADGIADKVASEMRNRLETYKILPIAFPKGCDILEIVARVSL